jgi:hypothetical protein
LSVDEVTAAGKPVVVAVVCVVRVLRVAANVGACLSTVPDCTVTVAHSADKVTSVASQVAGTVRKVSWQTRITVNAKKKTILKF